MRAALSGHDGRLAINLIQDGIDRAEGFLARHQSYGEVAEAVDVDNLAHRIRKLAADGGISNLEHRLKSFESDIKELVGLHSTFAKYVQFKNLLQEPDVMLTKTPRIPGLDGRKMSKSYGNAITLSETDEEIRKKTKVMVTDPARKRRTDPGNPDVCPVYDWHKLFSSPATLEWAAQGCRTAGIGCIECKAKMADHLIEWIAPVRERRLEYEKHPARVLEVIEEGSKRARVEAKKTIERVREAVFGWEKKRKEVGRDGQKSGT
jgi:tryptophanyl-tRNA synthetase